MRDGLPNNRPELLAPAGGPSEFNAALAAGADALYCGFGHTFNARRGAESFDSTTFADACRRAHVAGAKVYVTVNVVIRDNEMPVVLALVRRAWLLGADAFIVQDWGLLRQIRLRWPQVQCHISTQANVHDARAVAWCAELGASRVTLSRELSIAEVKTIAREGVELECFCHGAICICYSGVCSMSSCAGDRSANRGTCAQPCRLPYDLVDEKGEVLSTPGWGRPLCPKDFFSFDDLAELVDAGAASLKVEGRLKGPDYLVSVIGAYRAQLDDLLAGNKPASQDVQERHRSLKRVFNRDFTNAYLWGKSGNELMSYERSNNRGELVGEVVSSRLLGAIKVRRGGGGGGRERLRTVGVAEVDVLLHGPVFKGDLLEVRPIRDPSQFLTTVAEQDAQPGETITCGTRRTQEVGSLVRVIRSKAAMDAGERAGSLKVPRKRAVHVVVRARRGQPFVVELVTKSGQVRAEAAGPVMEPARTREVGRNDLIEHVGRMGSSPFEPVSFDVEVDEGLGIAYSVVHAVRAQACERLEQTILEPYSKRELSDIGRDAHLLPQMRKRRDRKPRSVEVCALVNDLAAARVARKAGASRVYVYSDNLHMEQCPTWVIPVLDEVCRQQDHQRIDPWIESGATVAVGNVSELVLAHRCGANAEVRPCIPVHNRSCLQALVDAGAQGVWLSPELSLNDIERVANGASVPIGLTVLGQPRAMTTEHCVLQVCNRCVGDCDACKIRRRKTWLQNDKGMRFLVRTDLQGRSRIYSSNTLDLTPYVPLLVAAGVTRLLADCSTLGIEQVAEAVGRVVCASTEDSLLAHVSADRADRLAGHLFEPIA